MCRGCLVGQWSTAPHPPSPSTGHCLLRVGNESIVQTIGTPYLFDQTRIHSVENHLRPGEVRVVVNIASFSRVSWRWLDAIHTAGTELTARAFAPKWAAPLVPAYDSHLVDGIVLRPTGSWTGFLKFGLRYLTQHSADVSSLRATLESDAGLKAPPGVTTEDVDRLLGLVVKLHNSLRSGLYVMSMLPELRFATLTTWCTHIVEAGVLGGFLEAGVWRGGAVAVMQHLSNDLTDKPTMAVLEALYDRLSVGGVVILDEYQLHIMGEGRAVDAFRASRGITSPIVHADHQSSFWVKREQ